MTASDEIRVTSPARPLDRSVMEELRSRLERCPDLAFAHLVDVEVPARGESAGLVLFVWLVPGALRSLRAALDLVSEIVAHALPADRYLDVVILNSAPELLSEVESVGCLLVEPHPEERRRALSALES